VADEPLGGGHRGPVERGDPAGHAVDEVVEFAVRECAVDPAVAFCGECVVVVAGHDDLGGSGPADEQREPLDPAAGGQHSGRYFELA
jgi:hypothetical protein